MQESFDHHAEVAPSPQGGKDRHSEPTEIDPYRDIVLAQIGGLRLIKPGIRRRRYRQGV